jgi:hypothetical protein
MRALIAELSDVEAKEGKPNSVVCFRWTPLTEEVQHIFVCIDG